MGVLLAIYLVQGLLPIAGGTVATAVVLEQLLICFGRVIEILFIWHYWRGQNWGRIFVLLWSFAVAAKELSTLVDNDGDLMALMSHPLRFFHALLAVFLLYWLNTVPVCAWFKKMSITAADLICDHLAGKLCTAIVESGAAPYPVWRLAFEHDAELTLTCPWRIVMDDNLAFASNLSSNPSGNPILEDEEQPQRLLLNLRVKAVRVAPRTSDLFVTFEMGIELQTWSTDPKSQQWRYSDPILTVIANSAGVNSQAVAADISTEDSATNGEAR
jgi:hypothetical protein